MSVADNPSPLLERRKLGFLPRGGDELRVDTPTDTPTLGAALAAISIVDLTQVESV